MSSGPTSQWWAGTSSSLRQISQTLRRENLRNINLEVGYESITEVTRKAAFIENRVVESYPARVEKPKWLNSPHNALEDTKSVEMTSYLSWIILEAVH